MKDKYIRFWQKVRSGAWDSWAQGPVNAPFISCFSMPMIKKQHKQVCILDGLQAFLLAILFKPQISSNLCFED